jgi:hypothetical protein
MVEFVQFSRIFYFLRGKKQYQEHIIIIILILILGASFFSNFADLPRGPPGIECLGQTHGTKASSDPLGCLLAVRWCVKRPHVHTCLRCGLAVAGLSPKATAIGAPESGGGNMPRASLRAETSMVPCGRPLRSLPGRILAPDRTDGFGSLNSSTPISAEFRLQTPAAAGPSDRGADGDGGGHAVPRLDVCVSTGG